MSLLRIGSRAIVLGGLTALILMAFGAEVSYAKSETKTATYYEDELRNLCVGLPTAGLFAGSCEWKGVGLPLDGQDNVGVGFDVLNSDTIGGGNVASGFKALFSNTEGDGNVASGTEALFSNTEGVNNVASGAAALTWNIGGSDNVASGSEALFHSTGSGNVATGARAGFNLTAGSNNIDIANEGVAAESGTTRIGTEGTQTKAYVAGIYEKPVTTPSCTVKVNSEGQLGCGSKEGGGSTGSAAIASFSSIQNVPNGQCLNSSEDEVGGPCPKKATSFPISALLSGPIPAGGATVSNLYAETNATVKGTDTVSVEAIDNTSGVALLSCAVDSTTKNHCSNSGASVPVAAGDRIEVKITASGKSGNNKQWQVTFRY
jgi:hypothetical protein